MIKVTSTTNTTYRNEVSGIVIRYSTSQENGETFNTVNAAIERYEQRAGSVSVDRDGYTGISLYKGLTAQERTDLLTTIMQDVEEIFNPKSA